MPTDKIKSVNELIKILGPLKKRGKRIVFTNGCFDILHKGHVKLLKKSKSFGDVLIVAINSDSSVKKIKGKNRPVNSAQDRAIVLSAIESVDYVTAFSEPDPARIIKRLGPDVLVKGGDWKKNKVIGSEFVTSRGGKVYSVPMAKGYSTSGMIKRIAKKADE